VETTTTSTTTVLRPFFRGHPGEPMPEENFWTLWCKGRLTKADTPTIRLGATPSGPTSAHLHHPTIFLQARCPSCHPTNSVKALKATSFTRKVLVKMAHACVCLLMRCQENNRFRVAVGTKFYRVKAVNPTTAPPLPSSPSAQADQPS